MSKEQVSRIYAVDFDSLLGESIRNYFGRVSAIDKAIDQFVATLVPDHHFPCDISHAQLVYSDDCDAGGLLGISVPKAVVGELTTDAAAVWDQVDDANDAARVIIIPRVERKKRFLRYGVANDLLKRMPQDEDSSVWQFPKPNMGDIEKGRQMHVCLYGELKRQIPDAAREALRGKNGKYPDDNTRIVPCIRYELPDDPSATPTPSAIRLCRAWYALPCVAANTLARILRLDMKPAMRHQQPEQAVDIEGIRSASFCHWRKDSAHHRYLFKTGLTSDLSEMQLVTDADAAAMFANE